MVTSAAVPHLTIATIHEFRTADGRLVTVRLKEIDVREIARSLATRAMRTDKRKVTALAGAIKASIHVGEKAA